MGHYVYKYVYDDEIIYIGKNNTKLETRINQHKLEDKFKPYLDSDIYYIELANETMSDVVESELIRRYRPRLNGAKMSEWCGLDFQEPECKLFIPSKEENHKKQNDFKNISKKNMKRMKERMKLCNLMANYYCEFMLKILINSKRRIRIMK